MEPRQTEQCLGRLVGGLFFAVVGLLPFAVGTWATWEILSAEVSYLVGGQTASATVYGKSTEAKRGAKGRTYTSYVVLYEFHDKAGKVSKGQGSVNIQKWKGVAVGDALRIQYLASDPARNRLWRPYRGSSLLALIPVAFALIGGGMIYGGCRRAVTEFHKYCQIQLSSPG